MAPAKKRESCLRERAENREVEVDCDSTGESLEEVASLDLSTAIERKYEEGGEP